MRFFAKQIQKIQVTETNQNRIPTTYLQVYCTHN